MCRQVFELKSGIGAVTVVYNITVEARRAHGIGRPVVMIESTSDHHDHIDSMR